MSSAARRVELLVYPDFNLLEVAGPLQVFCLAGMDCKPRNGDPARPYDAVVVARGTETVAMAGSRLATEPLPPPTGDIDTLIVAGGTGAAAASDDEVLIAWLRERASRARRIASVCTGAFLMGAAGLLDGRRVVTHWHATERLAARFPLAKVETDPIFVRDGNLWTSAGLTAGIDLALAMVEEDLGRATALAVARRLVVYMKRPGELPQISSALALQDDGRFEKLHAWIVENLRSDLSLAVLADKAGMSVRSFARHYRKSTGQTPMQLVDRLRVEAARLMLGEGRTVSATALRCGFSSAEAMRRTFVRLLGHKPSFYRAAFDLEPD